MLKTFYEYLMSRQNSYIPKYTDRMVLLGIGNQKLILLFYL